MALPKKTGADVRKSYFLFQGIGLALSLALVVGVALLPFESTRRRGLPTGNPEIVRLERIEKPQRIGAPPPTVQSPPTEIADASDIINEVVAELDLEENEPRPDSIVAPAHALSLPRGNVVPEIFEVVEQYPELIGGLERLQSRIIYPQAALDGNIEGTVILQFVVNEDGSVTDINVMRTPAASLSQAAANALRESLWRPGLQRGRPVKVRFSIPIRFRINEVTGTAEDSLRRVVES